MKEVTCFRMFVCLGCLMAAIVFSEQADGQSVEKVTEKLEGIVLPELILKDAGLAEAVGKVRELSRELDTEEKDPLWKGVRIGFEKIRPEDPVRLISLSLRNVTLDTAIDEICKAGGRRYDIFDDGVVLRRVSMDAGGMITRTFHIPVSYSKPPPEDPFAQEKSVRPKRTLHAKKVLEENGIVFPEGASAVLRNDRLTVRNTVENMKLVEAFVQAAKDPPSRQIIVRGEIYSIAILRAMELLDAEKAGGLTLIEAVRKEVADGGATLDAAPSVVSLSGQRAKVENGSEKEFVTHYKAVNGKDEPVISSFYHGTTLEVDPLCDLDGGIDLNIAVMHSTREILVRKTTVLAPVAGKEVSVDLPNVPNAEISTGVTVESGKTAFIGSIDDVIDSEKIYLIFVTAKVLEKNYYPVVPE